MFHDPAANCQAPSWIRRGALTPRGAVTYVRAARSPPDAGSARTTSGRPGPVRRRTRRTARPRYVAGAGRSDSPGAAAVRLVDAGPGTGCWRPSGAAGSARSTAGRSGLCRRRTARTARPRGNAHGRRGPCRPHGGAGSARSASGRRGPGPGRNRGTARPRGNAHGRQAYRPAGAAGSGS